MAKTTKKQTEKELPVEQEKKRAGRPKKEAEKLPTSSLKELEEQGSNYVVSDELKQDTENIDDTKIEIDNHFTEEEAKEVSDVLTYKEDISSIQKDIQELSKKTIVSEEENDNELKEKFVINAEELLSDTLNEELNKLENNPVLTLSPMALQYKKYIEYLKLTPEQFIQKYPTNKFLVYVQEIIDWKIKTGG